METFNHGVLGMKFKTLVDQGANLVKKSDRPSSGTYLLHISTQSKSVENKIIFQYENKERRDHDFHLYKSLIKK